VQNIKMERPGGPPPVPERRARALLLGSAPLVIVCGLVVMSEFGSMAKAMQKQSGSYSPGAANIAQIFGGSCNLSDKILVEKDPTSNLLRPVGGQAQVTGFHQQPVDADDPLSKPPDGFSPGAVPMWSSYRDQTAATGSLRTQWYELPEDAKNGQIVVGRAGQTTNGRDTWATSLTAEFGHRTANGDFQVVKKMPMPVAAANEKSAGWTDVRLDLAGQLDQGTDAVRLVVEDNDVREDGWVAVTPPRVSRMTTLTKFVGDQPVFLDWPVSFMFPCLDPAKMRDGIMEVPAYRITAGSLVTGIEWSDETGGGPTGLIQEMANQLDVPSVLEGDPTREWGQLLRVQPYADGVAPKVIIGEEVRQAWESDKGPDLAQTQDSTTQ
jgi:arabinosyltransferase C